MVNISEELVLEINNLLQDVCTFLHSNNSRFSSTDQLSADNLIDKMKKQLIEISELCTSNNGYIDMNCDKIKQLYESVNDNELSSESCSLSDFPAKNTVKEHKNGTILMRRKRFNLIEYSTKVYAAIHNNWLLLYWSDKDGKPFRMLDLKIYQAQEDEPLNLQEQFHNDNETNLNRKQQKRASYFKVFDHDEKKCYNFMANTHKDMVEWVVNINKQNEIIKSSLGSNQEDVYVEVYQNYHYLPPYTIDTRPPLPDRPLGFVTCPNNSLSSDNTNLKKSSIQSSDNDDSSSTYYELDSVPATITKEDKMADDKIGTDMKLTEQGQTEALPSAIGSEVFKKQRIFFRPNTWKHLKKPDNTCENEKIDSKLSISNKLPASIKHISSSVKIIELKKKSNINNVLANMIKKRSTNDFQPPPVSVKSSKNNDRRLLKLEETKRDSQVYTENIYEELTVGTAQSLSCTNFSNNNVMKIVREKKNSIERNSVLLTFQKDNIKDISIDLNKETTSELIAIESHCSNLNRIENEVPKVLLTNNQNEENKFRKISPNKLKLSRKK